MQVSDRADKPSRPTSADGDATRWGASVLVDLYRGDDGRLLTYDLLQEEVEAEIEEQGIPEESWRDGYFDFHDYLVESVMVGTFEQVHVESIVVTTYTNGTTVWTHEQMRDIERTTLRRHEFHGEWNYSLAPGWSGPP
jgi:hypothetical protein